MKKLCPNLDREDGLETVLEVPIPDEIFTIKSGTTRAWQNMKSWMKPNVVESRSSSSSSLSLFGDRNTDIQLLLGVVGAPLVPFPITSEYQPIITRTVKGHNIVSNLLPYKKIKFQYLKLTQNFHQKKKVVTQKFSDCDTCHFFTNFLSKIVFYFKIFF